MASSTVNTRALKDEVAGLLRKGKFDRAADVLEQLARAEPKEMTHRLKLGDTYRRLDQKVKAIAAYQYAAKFFGDEGQLIKAIGAVKIILELDPANGAAQAQLADMNNRRLGKVTLESAGLRAPSSPPPRTAIELGDAAAAAHAIGSANQVELEPGDDDEPLELDDGKPSRGVAPAGGPVLVKKTKTEPRAPGPPPKIRPAFELGNNEPPDLRVPPPIAPPRYGKRSHEPIELPPDDAPQKIDLDPHEIGSAALPMPDAPVELDPSVLVPLEEASTAKIPVPAAKPSDTPSQPLAKIAVGPKGAKPSISVSDEIDFEDEDDEQDTTAHPIADLLSGSAEDEVEVLALAAEEEVRSAARAAQAAPKKVATKKVPLFDDLSQAAFVELVNKLDFHRHEPGQLIIREGDPGRSFYVIASGQVRIYKSSEDGAEITLARLGEGAFFGEMALLSGAPRTANVVAEEDTELLEVTDVVLRDLAGKYPQVVTSLKNFYRQRLLANVMAISPLFRDFDPQERKGLAEKFRMKQAASGEVLISEGSSSDGLYVVLHGAVQVTATKDGKRVELARLKEGEIFGEMSLLTRKPATATVTAAGNAILLRLPRESFQELVLTHPQVLELVSELTEKRKSATEAILSGENGGMAFV